MEPSLPAHHLVNYSPMPQLFTAALFWHCICDWDLTARNNELNKRNGWLKIGLATLVCLLILYFYDLYDFTVMGNRRELMLRLVQALGIAWALLAFLFYFVPPLFIGRGVSVISVPLVLNFTFNLAHFDSSFDRTSRNRRKNFDCRHGKRGSRYGGIGLGTTRCGLSNRRICYGKRHKAERYFARK